MIATRLNTASTVSAGGLAPVGSVIHRSGCNVSASGNVWLIEGSGYHKIEANVAISPTVAGAVTVTMLSNGQPIATASGVTASADDLLTLPLMAVVYSKCKCSSNSITIEVSANATISELDVVIEGR